MNTDAIAFMPGLGADHHITRYWLRQATLRLRREVCWLWRERALQGLAVAAASTSAPVPVPAAQAFAADLPPFADAAQGALDLARYADDKQRFFAEDVTARHLSQSLAGAAPDPQAAPRGSLGWVIAELALSPAEAFALALALLPVVDSAAAAVIACCLNEPGRGEPTLALAQRLWDVPDEFLCGIDPGHALYRHGLLSPAAQGWGSPLLMPAAVARELMFPAAVALDRHQRGAAAADAHAGAHVNAGDNPGARAFHPPARRRVIPVLGAPGVALVDAAQQAAAASGLTMNQADSHIAADHGGAQALAHLRAQMSVAWLRGAALYLPLSALLTDDGHGHGATGEAAAHVPTMPLPELPLTLYIGLHERAPIRHLGDAVLPTLHVAAASHADRLAAWQAALPALADDPLLPELARRYRCETPAIARIAAELSQLGRPPTADELQAATRADLDLGALAQAVDSRFGLAELMLPPAQARQVDEVVTAMRNLGRVHHRWGTAKAWSDGGLAALFAGPPGTGKTMAAEALATELDLPMYRIDLSQVVNKYIGETEKNLKRLFDAADAAEVILFFDEADALFGKRTEVKDAHDRYANLEISYLLERMERFKGLAILATNRRKDLDDAFLRRLRFVIEFPLPGVAERERIWRSVLPAGVDASALDIEFLAQRFALAGGHIRAIVFAACLQSAHADAPPALTMQAVIRAVQREYDKLDRASSLEQFGRYAPLVAADRISR